MWFTSCTLEHGTHCVVHWHLHSVLYLIAVETMPNWMLEWVQWSLLYTGKGDKRSGHFTVASYLHKCNLSVPLFHHTCWHQTRKNLSFYSPLDSWEVRLTSRLFAGMPLLADLCGIWGMACFTLVTCPHVYHVSGQAFTWCYALWHPRWLRPSGSLTGVRHRHTRSDTPEESWMSGYSSSF